MVNANSVFTIGHSNHLWEAFSGLLSHYGVRCLLDVRSTPFSRFAPQYNRDQLCIALRTLDVGYLFLGRELGGRPDDPSCYHGGRVSYDLMARTNAFRRGIDVAIEAAERDLSVLMCSEKDPLDCHRTLLVAQAIGEAGMGVVHVLADGTTETHDLAMDRLLKKHGMSIEGDLLTPREDLIGMAVRRQSEHIAFVGS